MKQCIFSPEIIQKLTELNWRNIEDTNKADTFLVGYPKSGTTWLQTVLVAIIYGCDPVLTPNSLEQDLIPDVHARKVYRRYLPRVVFKSHHFPMDAYKKVIYIVRDGRDVMVSYLHFINSILPEPVSFERLILGEPPFPGKWHEHVKSWEKNPFNSEIIWVRYEDLLLNPAREILRIALFLEVELSEERAAVIAEKTSFMNQKEKESRIGVELKVVHTGNMITRRGVAGSFRDEMPDSIREVFEEQAGDVLKRLGYL